MAQTTAEPAPKKGLTGWIKTIATSLAGALSGAVLMYASPLVDMVVKPANPIANFQSQANGLTVTMQNKSTSGHEGWWDFGDGSALEPYVADEATVTHTYAKAGSYTVKLTLKNLVGEQNERAVNVVVEQGGTSLPSIDTFDVVATQGDYAPATYRVVTTVNNAELCVWEVGTKALEFSPDTANGSQERLVTFKEPGSHVMKLAAYNGKQAVEKTQTVVVKKAPAGLMTATVEVSYDAVLIEQKDTSTVVQLQFPMEQKGDVATITRPVAANLGFEIIKAEVASTAKNPGIKSAKVEIDRTKRDHAVLTCELVHPSGAKSPRAWTVQVALTQQRQSASTVKSTEPVSVNLTVPGSTTVPLPALPTGWVAKSHKLALALQQNEKHVDWKDGQLPHNAAVQMASGATYLVNAIEESGQLRIDVSEIQKAISAFGN
jgi:PKD repeat protein